jgi:hypothetical protein
MLDQRGAGQGGDRHRAHIDPTCSGRRSALSSTNTACRRQAQHQRPEQQRALNTHENAAVSTVRITTDCGATTLLAGISARSWWQDACCRQIKLLQIDFDSRWLSRSHYPTMSLTPFVAGMVLAYLLDPLATRLERLGMNRLIATLTIVGMSGSCMGSQLIRTDRG